ncbi:MULTISPECIES: hypothetical protein [Microcystis]|nr:MULTISPECIES: hypothetical protein [Microcystis]WNF14137.1 hypothetical protein RKE53_19040 [Microcystis aeruginosa NRERC-214]
MWERTDIVNFHDHRYRNPDRTMVTGDQLMIKIENLKLIVKNYGR